MSEVVVRPDFEAVVSDEKNREIIEEFESEAKTRSLTGWWARIATSLSVATTLFALYYAAAGAEIPFTSIVLVPTISVFGETITTKQIYEMLFLAAVLTLHVLLDGPDVVPEVLAPRRLDSREDPHDRDDTGVIRFPGRGSAMGRARETPHTPP